MQNEIDRLNIKLRTFPVGSEERKIYQEAVDEINSFHNARKDLQVKLHIAEDSLCASCEG